MGFDPVNWRRWDICVFQHTDKPSQGHVSFLMGVTNLNKPNFITKSLAQSGESPNMQMRCFGGNQSDQLQESMYSSVGNDMKLLSVRRNWNVPSWFDYVPIVDSKGVEQGGATR